MGFLWKIVDRYCPEELETGVFLAVNILTWSIGTLAAGMLFCLVAAQAAVESCIANVMCMAVYAGIIFGLFGGIVFLMRRDGKISKGMYKN